MATDKQKEANKRNSMLSTGPKSAVGKQISSLNSIKHGLLSRELWITDDEQSEFEEFAQSLHEELVPVGVLEGLLVEKIIATAWRLKLAVKVEAGLFAERSSVCIDFFEDEKTEQTKLAGRFVDEREGFLNLNRYESSLEKAFFRAIHELQRLQAFRTGRNASIPLAIDLDFPEPEHSE